MDAVLAQVHSHPALDLVNHSLGYALKHYISGKLWLEVLELPWSNIVVRGSYQRHVNGQFPQKEKTDKRFNWQRPTAILINEHTLEISCFPGEDYVKHYAMLVQAHMKMRNRMSTTVQYIIPSTRECLRIFLRSNLEDMGQIDVAVIGYVERFEGLAESWKTGPRNSEKLFGWQKFRRPNGSIVALVGCTISFWGDISNYLVEALSTFNSIRSLLFVGKSGSIRPQDQPNSLLITGDKSFVDGTEVVWNNILYDTVIGTDWPADIAFGTHITVSSPLETTEAWLQKWQDSGEWVDCEVGRMANACNIRNISFGYLNIISDNAAVEKGENLSNERLDSVLVKRKHLLSVAQSIIQRYLGIDFGVTS